MARYRVDGPIGLAGPGDLWNLQCGAGSTLDRGRTRWVFQVYGSRLMEKSDETRTNWLLAKVILSLSKEALAGLAPENPLEITLSASHSADALRK